MIAEFSPKDNYQSFHADCSEELARQADKRWFTVSIAYALAQLAHGGATTDEISGARRFISNLVNLPSKATATMSFPKRELKSLESSEQ